MIPAPTARIVRVVPDIPAVHRRFDYRVPPSMADAVRVGSRVRIDLHGRRVAAWVVDVDIGPTEGITAKPLAVSSGTGPPASVVSLAEWAAWRWAGPVCSFLGTASPSRVVRDPPAAAGPVGPAGPGGGGDRPASPGGGSVVLVDRVLEADPVPSVVRLAPALDAVLVVLELIHRVGPAGVLVLVPSHVRAAAVADRLRKWGVPVALLPDQWEQAATGRSVVVGTRAAAWAPIPELRAAAVLDAHDEAYREERSPTWSAVDVVVERAARDRVPLALVTPCPTVTLLEPSRLVTTARAVERMGWAVVDVVDRTGDDPRTGLFSDRLARALHAVLERPEGRAVCVLNRTGRVRLLACAACGSVARCTRCGNSVVQAEAEGALECRRCGESRPALCGVCDSSRLRTLRVGVTRATEELSALTGVAAVEVTASSDRSHESEARLVVGTEAALHRAGRVDLVAFLDFDQHLLAARFAAGEEALALLARAARLVGARESGGRVLVQTRIPTHEALIAACRADPAHLSESERRVREALDLPPFGALAQLRGPGAPQYAAGLSAIAGITVSSSEPDRWLVRATDHRTLCDGLDEVARPTERVRVAVDPTDV